MADIVIQSLTPPQPMVSAQQADLAQAEMERRRRKRRR